METKNSQQLELEKLEKEKSKYKRELDLEKEKLIKQLSKLNKEEILPEKPKELTLWQKIKKALMG